MSLSCATELLASYSGRDKILKTITYTTLYLSGVSKDKEVSIKFRTISSRISGCRAILRLFDDLPMLKYNLSYGFGKHEPDTLLRILELIKNAVDQIFYPIEHVEWAANAKLITLKNVESWSSANSMCWCLSLYLTLLSAIRKLSLITRQRRQCETDVARQATLRAEQHASMLIAVQSLLDLGHAIHWLPKGFLWAGTLQPWQRGLLGSLASFINLYRAIKNLRS